jgi:hypothetical protein
MALPIGEMLVEPMLLGLLTQWAPRTHPAVCTISCQDVLPQDATTAKTKPGGAYLIVDWGLSQAIDIIK